jgi:WD40 repeat protein
VLALAVVGCILPLASCSDERVNFPYNINEKVELLLPYGPTAIGWSDDGSRVYTTDPSTHETLIWNAADGRLLTKTKAPSLQYFGQTSLVRSGSAIVSLTVYPGRGPIRLEERTISLGNIINKYVSDIKYSPGDVFCINEKHDLLVSVVSTDDSIQIFKLNEGKFLKSIHAPNKKLMSVYCLTDGSAVAAGTFDGTVILFNLKGAAPPRELRVFAENPLESHWISSVAVSPDGNLLLPGGSLMVHTFDRRVGERLWRGQPGARVVRVTDGAVIADAPFGPNHVGSIAWDPKGRFVAWVGTFDEGLRHALYLWNPMASPPSYAKIPLPSDGALAISPDGSRIAVETIRGVSIFSIESQPR